MKKTFLFRVFGISVAIFITLFIFVLLIYLDFNTTAIPEYKTKTTTQNSVKLKNIPKIYTNRTNKKLSKNLIRIFLDPMHGGEDTGFSWSYNNRIYNESVVNLNFALSLARYLRKKGVITELSRVGDYELSLENRYDKFISLSEAIYIPIIVSYTENDGAGLCFFAGSWLDTHSQLELRENTKFSIEIATDKKPIHIMEIEDFFLNRLKENIDKSKLMRCKNLYGTRHNFHFLGLFTDSVSLVLSIGFVNKEEDRYKIAYNLDKLAKNLAKVIAGAIGEYYDKRTNRFD